MSSSWNWSASSSHHPPPPAPTCCSLAAPPERPIRVPAGTRVGTERGDGDDQVVFLTDADLTLVSPTLVACLTRSGGRFEDHTDELGLAGAQVPVFPTVTPNDALY